MANTPQVADGVPYRKEALSRREEGTKAGDILRFDPRWVTVAYWLVAAFAGGAAAVTFLSSVDEHASGPAVVRVDGRRMVATSSAGSVDVIEVRPGEQVEQGAPLVRLGDAEERRELTRASNELDVELLRLLADPNDSVTKQSIAGLRARRDQASNAVDGRVVRAPVAGTVSDVRVRPGQHVKPGDVICAVAPKEATTVSLLAMVPSDYRPLLKAGQPMRFELDGFKYEYADLVTSEVSSESIGSGEVQRLLGNERADSVHLETGGKVLVMATFPTSTFASEGKSYGYFDGMTGRAEIRVRREPLVVTLIPALRRLLP